MSQELVFAPMSEGRGFSYMGPPVVRPASHPPTSVPAQRVDGWTRMHLDLGRPAFSENPAD